MTNIYLRNPEGPFTLWKWIVFGSLFLLTLDYLSFLLNSASVFWLGIFLGHAIMVRTTIAANLSLILKILGAIGLLLLISLIATSILWVYCFAQPTQNICAPNYIRAYTFGNFTFPLIAIFGWVVGEIYKSVKGTVSYISRINKSKHIGRYK